MKRIYKYQLKVTDVNTVEMPHGAEILCVQVQGKIPCIWALVEDSETNFEKRTILTYGTGHSTLNTLMHYIGTYQIENGALVFHVFEEV